MILEKAEECPRCGEVKRWLYDAQICAACDYGNTVSVTKHRQRAVDAMAGHLCSIDFTDGFCAPRDGKCHNPTAKRRADRDCVAVAQGLMRSIESVGCKVTWTFDKARPTHKEGE